MTRASLSRPVAACVVLMALARPVSAGEVTLGWNPNVEPNIAGYIVSYGTQSRVYAASVDVGARTTWTVTGLMEGQAYYFAVQAYNTARIVSPLSAEVGTTLPFPGQPPPTPPSSGGNTSACTTPRPGADWICDATTGNWLPPGYPGNGNGSGSAGACTTAQPGPTWTCDATTGNWLPPGYPGNGNGGGSGVAGACTTVQPGPNWTCDTATGNWLPPGYPGNGNGGGSGSAGGCTTVQPGPNWTCDTATGNWLPPGYKEEKSSASAQGGQALLLYLYDPARGSPLTGWAELSPALTDGGRTDVLRNKEKIGEWYPGPTSSDRGFTFYVGSTQGAVPVGTELAVWQPSTGLWYVLKTDNGKDFSSQAVVPLGDGAAGDRPVPGDYDGDKKTDVAVYRTSDHLWYVLTSSTGFAASHTVAWGEADDVPVPADYDGDGRTDVAVWRPSTGEWLVLKSTSGYDAAQTLRVQWGEQGDVPLPADYDGDGAADMAFWRPSTGEWWVLPASSKYDWLRGYLRTQGKAPADISLRR